MGLVNWGVDLPAQVCEVYTQEGQHRTRASDRMYLVLVSPRQALAVVVVDLGAASAGQTSARDFSLLYWQRGHSPKGWQSTELCWLVGHSSGGDG